VFATVAETPLLNLRRTGSICLAVTLRITFSSYCFPAVDLDGGLAELVLDCSKVLCVSEVLTLENMPTPDPFVAEVFGFRIPVLAFRSCLYFESCRAWLVDIWRYDTDGYSLL